MDGVGGARRQRQLFLVGATVSAVVAGFAPAALASGTSPVRPAAASAPAGPPSGKSPGVNPSPTPSASASVGLSPTPTASPAPGPSPSGSGSPSAAASSSSHSPTPRISPSTSPTPKASASPLSGGVSPLTSFSSRSAQAPLPDPTGVYDNGSYEYTFGTSSDFNWNSCDNGGTGSKHWVVPYLRTAVSTATSGSTLANQCYAGDAMPSGAGSWAASGSPVWAPGVIQQGSVYRMYHAAKTPSGQECTGLATSSSIAGPYSGQHIWDCPTDTLRSWAIDPQPFASGGNIYVAFRDDYQRPADQGTAGMAISTVEVDSNGAAIWSTRATALQSDQVTWDYSSRTSAYVVENPVMWLGSDGYWYLFFSGNDFATQSYATGIASCGSSPLPASRCKPLSSSQPYFGYSASNPITTLPENHLGPGGMTPYKTGSGDRAVWAWNSYPYPGTSIRPVENGVLTQGGSSGIYSTWSVS